MRISSLSGTRNRYRNVMINMSIDISLDNFTKESIIRAATRYIQSYKNVSKNYTFLCSFYVILHKNERITRDDSISLTCQLYSLLKDEKENTIILR